MSEEELRKITVERALDRIYPIVYLDCIVTKVQQDNWDNIITLFEFPKDVRKIIYTTNAIESLNSVIRKNINNKRVFPNNSAALKMIYLPIRQATEKWTMPIHDWRPAMNAFNITYGLDL